MESATQKNIEKMKELLKNARDTSLWWGQNKKSAKRYTSLGGVLLITGGFVCAVAVAVLFSIWSRFVPPSELVRFLACATGVVGLLVGAFVYRKVFEKWEGYVSKRFEEGHRLCGFNFMRELNSHPHHRTNETIVQMVLRMSHSMPLPEIQNLCPHLEKLRSADLPLSWWFEMKRALEGVKIQKDTVCNDPHDVLEQVYIEMAEPPPPPTSDPRVLKL